MKITPRNSFALAVGLGAFAFIGGTGLTVSSAWLITMASQHPPILVLSVAIVAVRFFGIFRSLARYAERVISHEAIFRKLTAARVRLYQAVTSRLATIDVARNSKAIIDDVERAQEFALRVTLPGFSAIVAGIFTALVALWIDAMVLIWILPALLIYALLIPFAVRALLDPLARAIEVEEADYADAISAASLARIEAEVYGYANYYQSLLEVKSARLVKLEVKFHRLSSLLQCIVIATMGASLVGASQLLTAREDLLPVQISMALFLVLVGYEGFTSWFPNLFPAGKNRRAASHIDELADYTPRTHELRTSEGFRVIAKDLSPFWSEPFLPPINFTVEEGSTLVISGESGVGKSTLASAFFGFASFKGSLTIGGVEVSNLDNRSLICVGSLQNSHIFNTTLRENLKIADSSVEDGELILLMKDLELDALSLDEVLGEFGRTLSGGEAKRLAIARALLSPAKILILDEPLEHLDHDRAVRIQAAITRRAARRTLIVITHAPWLQYSEKVVLTRE